MEPNYLNLRYFLEVASCSSFSQAAQRLHISQPALSQQIHALEKELDIKLFTRTTRRVSLTPEGEYVYKQLLPSFQHIQKTMEELRRSKTAGVTVIRIATIPSAASNILPLLIKKLQEKHPSVEYFIKETNSRDAVELVQKGEYQLALIRTPIHDRQRIVSPLKSMEFFRYPLQLVISRNHPAAHNDEAELVHFRNETFVHFDPLTSPTMCALLEQACRTAGFIPNTICSGPEMFTIASLIANGVGVTLLPQDMIQLLQSDRLKVISLKDEPLLSSLSAVWHSTNPPAVIEDALHILAQNTI